MVRPCAPLLATCMTPSPLPRSFFARPTLTVARELLGQRLVRVLNGRRVAGLILETEAYIGETDLACHARVGRTARNAAMYGPPGHVYMYFTYGMHWMLNFVTEAEGFPAAVLVRALLPQEGLATLRRRRHGLADAHLTDGPAKLTQALGLTGRQNRLDVCAPAARLFVEPQPVLPAAAVVCGPRVGIAYAPEPWLSQPWNFKWCPGLNV